MRQRIAGSVQLLITSKSQIQNSNTYRIDNSHTPPSSTDSTRMVERPANIGRIWESTLKSSKPNGLLGRLDRRHLRQLWFSKMPSSLVREICWLSTGRIPRGRTSVKTLFIASRISPGSSLSDGDSWIELQLMGCQIGVAGINLRESYTPSAQFYWPPVFQNYFWYRYRTNKVQTSMWGKVAGHSCQTHF